MSAVGQLLGDSLVGSCWRAFESAHGSADVEARIYVRSFAEAFVALDILMAMAGTKGVLVSHDKENAAKLADETESFVALELINGSVISLRPERARTSPSTREKTPGHTSRETERGR